jgi:protein phosphatase 2C family protein 2/3
LNVHYFAIYDGHGGDRVAEILRNNLHKLIIYDPNFLKDPEGVILKSFATVENELKKPENIDKSGSCAVVIILIGNNIY